MKWTYRIKNKIIASVSLLSLCVLVLISNYIDRNHTENVKNTIGTLYEDRLIAEGYIFKMSNEVFRIKEVLQTDWGKTVKIDKIGTLNTNISEKNAAYQKTKLTAAEKSKAAELTTTLNRFMDTEIDQAQQKLKAADEALAILNELSVIQLEESKQIMNQAEKLYISGKNSSEFVFAIIIIILLVLQAMVFASKTLIPTNRNMPHNLN
jgi:hypothetical protein